MITKLLHEENSQYQGSYTRRPLGDECQEVHLIVCAVQNHDNYLLCSNNKQNTTPRLLVLNKKLFRKRLAKKLPLFLFREFSGLCRLVCDHPYTICHYLNSSDVRLDQDNRNERRRKVFQFERITLVYYWVQLY